MAPRRDEGAGKKWGVIVYSGYNQTVAPILSTVFLILRRKK